LTPARIKEFGDTLSFFPPNFNRNYYSRNSDMCVGLDWRAEEGHYWGWSEWYQIEGTKVYAPDGSRNNWTFDIGADSITGHCYNSNGDLIHTWLYLRQH
jgi:hypothetical protein